MLEAWPDCGAEVATVNLEAYVCHARLFGAECVMETFKAELLRARPCPVDLLQLTAREQDHVFAGREALRRDMSEATIRLRIELDQLERERKGRSGRFTVGKARRRINGETAAMARSLSHDGLVASEIAAKLGVTARHVDRLLATTAQ